MTIKFNYIHRLVYIAFKQYINTCLHFRLLHYEFISSKTWLYVHWISDYNKYELCCLRFLPVQLTDSPIIKLSMCLSKITLNMFSFHSLWSTPISSDDCLQSHQQSWKTCQKPAAKFVNGCVLWSFCCKYSNLSMGQHPAAF